jgi:predicted amidohydrolase YtcJ
MASGDDGSLARRSLNKLQRGLAALLIAVVAGEATAASPTLYVGRILTMDPKLPVAGAVLVEGERIIAVGGDELRAMHNAHSTVVELQDRVMLPGFIDAHGHLTATAAYINFINLAPPPVGPVDTIATLQATLREHVAQRQIPAGQWIVGVGYDDSLLAEKRHPTRDDLDAISPDHPLIVVHVSGHLSAGNSALLRLLGIDATTVDPPGGAYRRRADSSEPNGVFEELAHYAVLARLPRPDSSQALQGLSDTLRYMASMGLTTVQDGGASSENIQLLQAAAERGLLDLDVVAYRYWSPVGAALPREQISTAYRNRFRIDGVKIILDGSPQGKTAFLSEPYAVPPAGRDSSYRGYPSLPAPAVKKAVAAALDANVPLLAHANGDAAAQMLIDAVEQSDVTDHPRVVMIHSQTVRNDQLDRMAQLGITPSFFVSHTFFWGDWHRDETLGAARAVNISPTRAATERGIRYTLHNDPPVVPPDMIRTLWSATTRLTRSGAVLGEAQRAHIAEALAAITIDAARQYGEEATKGSITVGKQADFVILDRDPTSLEPEKLLELKVLETISRGRSVYRAPELRYGEASKPN